MASRVFYTFIRWYRHKFREKNHVFVRRGPFPATDTGGYEVACFENGADIPASIIAQLEAVNGAKAVRLDHRELRCGAVMWVAMNGDVVAGTSMSRKGRHFRRWFVPLKDEDIVIFRNRTFPEDRGKGICPMLMRHIMHTQLTEGGCAYVDCRVYNKASIRSIEKAGFERIATMKPITRHEALKVSDAL